MYQCGGRLGTHRVVTTPVGLPACLLAYESRLAILTKAFLLEPSTMLDYAMYSI